MREMECTRWFILTLRGFVCKRGGSLAGMNVSASALGDVMGWLSDVCNLKNVCLLWAVTVL